MDKWFKYLNMLLGIAAVTILVPFLVKSCIDSETAERDARQQQYDRKNAWYWQHKCHRTSYDHGNAVYTCDDGEIYEWRDIPEQK